MKTYAIKYHCRWDDHGAEWNEWYTLVYLHKSWRGKLVWKTVMTGCGEFSFPLTGDRKWAEKQAKHYEVTLPKARKK